MKAMIKKDFYNMKNNLKGIIYSIFVMAAVILLVNDTDGKSIGLLVANTTIFAMLIITSMSFDDQSNWNKQAIIMPIKKSDIVLSKYIIHIGFILAGIIVGSIIFFVYGFLNNNIIMDQFIISIGVAITIGLFIGSSMIPLVYKFGTEKARLYLIIVLFIPGIIVFIGYKILDRLNPSFINNFNLESLIFLLPILSIILFFISYKISVKIFKSKEY